MRKEIRLFAEEGAQHKPYMLNDISALACVLNKILFEVFSGTKPTKLPFINDADLGVIKIAFNLHVGRPFWFSCGGMFGSSESAGQLSEEAVYDAIP